MIGAEPVDDRVAKRLQVGLVGDIDPVGDDAGVGGLVGDDGRRLLHRVGGDVAEGHVGPCDGQLTHELSAHTCSAAGDHRDGAVEVVDHFQCTFTGSCL